VTICFGNVTKLSANIRPVGILKQSKAYAVKAVKQSS